VHGVRVGIDADQHAFVLGHAAVRVEEIEPLRVRVQLQEAAACGRLADDLQHVDVVGLARVDQPPERVREDGHERMIERLEDTRGLPLARESAAVYGRDDDGEPAARHPAMSARPDVASMPVSNLMPVSEADSRAISSHCLRRRCGSRPRATVRRRE
jgi:hypothetical protein